MTDHAETTTTEAVPKAHRRRRASTGGQALKLVAPQREGFVRRWVLDDPSRIEEMHGLGYDFAEPPKGPGRPRTDGLGTRITRHAGKSKEGKAQQLILMETPQEEYDFGKREKEERVATIDQAIREGTDTQRQLDGAYKPRDGSSISHNNG